MFSALPPANRVASLGKPSDHCKAAVTRGSSSTRPKLIAVKMPDDTPLYGLHRPSPAPHSKRCGYQGQEGQQQGGGFWGSSRTF